MCRRPSTGSGLPGAERAHAPGGPAESRRQTPRNSIAFSMVDSMLIKGVQLWPFRGELQVFFAAALQTLATCYFRCLWKYFHKGR